VVTVKKYFGMTPCTLVQIYRYFRISYCSNLVCCKNGRNYAPFKDLYISKT